VPPVAWMEARTPGTVSFQMAARPLHDGQMVAMFASDWRRRRVQEEWKNIAFHTMREQHGLSGAAA